MSGKKNQLDLVRRRIDVAKEVRERANEKTEAVVNDIAERLYLRPGTIYGDLKKVKASELNAVTRPNY
jgi:hypothetical protein